MADSNGRRWRDRWTRLKRLVTHPLSKLGLVAAVLLVLVGISVALYKSLAVQQYTSRATFYPQSPDRIRFILRLVNADLLNHRLIMSVRTYPEGRYRAEQSTPSQNISVEIDTILRKYWWLTGMPIPIAPFDHALNTVGDPNLFPFDYSTSSFKVKAYGFNDPNLVIPVAIEFINNVATLDVTTTVEAATDPGDLAAAAVRVHIDVGRLTTVKVYAIFCAVLCWVLAIVVLMLSMDQLGKRKQVELPILAWVRSNLSRELRN